MFWIGLLTLGMLNLGVLFILSRKIERAYEKISGSRWKG